MSVEMLHIETILQEQWLLIATIVAVSSVALFIVATTVRAPKRWGLASAADQTLFADTKDGQRLAVLRYVPANPRQNDLPVILCHGLGANRFNMDFSTTLSLARYLRQRGYDVFVIELRGVGLSSRPRSWTFDDHVLFDVPAAIECVLAATGASKLNWVGHSMGGMVMYAALSGPVAAQINSVVAVGSPVLRDHNRLRQIAQFYPLVSWFPTSAQERMMRFLAPFARGVQYLPGGGLFFNQANVDPEVTRQAMYNLVSNVSSGVLRQFVRWIRTGHFTNLDGTIDYDAGLAKVTVPIMLIGGSKDFFCPPDVLQYIYDKVASHDKKLKILNVANGASADYGHGDLLVGRAAPRDVYPAIESFLWDHRRLVDQSGSRAA